MTKITFVVPYTEKRELVGLINRIVAESDCPDNVRFDILHSKDRVDDSSAYWDSDIVIARGLAYSVLKQERRNFHLIEVPISGIDILKAVLLPRRRPRGTVFGPDHQRGSKAAGGPVPCEHQPLRRRQ